jgi:hypothetical protein
MVSGRLGNLLKAVGVLESHLDAVLDAAPDGLARRDVDWAYYRLATTRVLVRDEGGATVAAALARGLAEEAAYWDWAAAEGVGADHLAMRAADEHQRLTTVAERVDDRLWLDWLLPPGAELANAGDPLPRRSKDVIRKMGGGLDGPLLEPLQLRGFYSAYELLEVLTHGGLAAAQILAPTGGATLPIPLAAAVLHVASAGTVVVAAERLALPAPTVKVMLEDLDMIISIASELHGLTTAPSPATGRIRTKPSPRLAVAATIGQLPAAPDQLTALAGDYTRTAQATLGVAARHVRDDDPIARWALGVLGVGWAQLTILQGVVQGTLAPALLPPAARGLFEEGARWSWASECFRADPDGSTAKSLVAESQRYLRRIIDGLVNDGVPHAEAHALTNIAAGATQVADAETPRLPSLTEMLAGAYPMPAGLDSAGPIYSVLSQFVHATPLAVLHLMPDTWPTLSAPTFAVAVDAATRGFTSTAHTTLAMACHPSADFDRALEQLGGSCAAVVTAAMGVHCIA